MPPPRILLISNCAWNLWNYRRALVQALQQAGYEVLLAAPEDRFSASLTAAFYPLPSLKCRWTSPLAVGRAIAEVARLMRRERPEICLLFTTSANLLGGWAAQMTQTPYIAVVEGLGYAGANALRWRLIGRPLFRSALQAAQRVLFLNSNDLRETVAQGIIAPERAQLVPGPGIDEAHFTPRASPARGEVIFLYCGRLLRTKGVHLFAQAAHIVRAAGVSAVFRILGAPDPTNPASMNVEEVMQWHRAGVVEYLGYADDVRPHLAEADALVLPTYYREGMPRALLEAMCMEKITIATDMPGCREVVVPEQTGFLVPPRDAQALAKTMLLVAALTPEQRALMSQKARQRVVAHFSNGVVLPHFLRIVEEAIHEKRKLSA